MTGAESPAHCRPADHGEPRAPHAPLGAGGGALAPGDRAPPRRRRLGSTPAPPRAVPAPALRRACDSGSHGRDGARAEPERLDRRRADDGARRDDPGACSSGSCVKRQRAGHGADPDHPRPRGRRVDDRPGGGDVRGPSSETGPDGGTVFSEPSHPYTLGLLQSPSRAWTGGHRCAASPSIPGTPPPMGDALPGGVQLSVRSAARRGDAAVGGRGAAADGRRGRGGA